MNPAISFSSLCPDCAHEMIECNGKWICLNVECESMELKAPDNCSAEIEQESVVDCTAVTPRQDKESGAKVRQKGAVEY